MGRVRRGTGAARTGQLLLVALGAVAGLAIGMAIADRAGGMDGLLRRKGSRRQRRHREDGWRGDERRSQQFDGLEDDDAELAPEAISHLHLRGRHPDPSAVRMRRSPTGPMAQPSADALEARVLDVFRNDPTMAERNIDIEADQHGRVELTGWVDNEAEVAYALTLVRGVPQVHDVLNHLAVRPRAAG